MNAPKLTLDELRHRKAQREVAKDAEATERERLELELEERFEAELGARGAAFEIVRSIEGPIVLKLGSEMAFKKMRAAYDKAIPNIEQMFEYVAACVVHPERAKFAEIVGRRPGLLVACTDAEAELHRGKEREVQGK